MNRLTLFMQMALLLALCLAVALAINFTTLVDARRSNGMEVAILPAAQQLAKAVAEQTGRTPEQSTKSRTVTPSEVTAHAPGPPSGTRLHNAEPRVGQILRQNQLHPREVRAFNTGETWRGTGKLHLAAKLDDGRWISVRAPGPPPLGPIMARVLEQMLLLFAVIALPALLLLRRSGRALRRLTDAARGPVGSVIPQPLPVEGPRDVRQLTESFNSMRTRIATMIEDRNIMLGAVGHDLRTPLTALRLEAEGVADLDSRTALVEQIEAIAGQLDEIIRLARYGQPVVDPERLDVSRIIRNLVDTRYAAMREFIVLSGAGPAQVEGDPAALARMVQNLIDNALRYGERAEVTVGRSGQSALLIIGDRGPGISSDRIADAVRPFGRLEPSRNVDMGGHGLGLAIVEQVVRAHGGEWSLANRAGGGLEVRVLLPLAPDDASITLGA